MQTVQKSKLKPKPKGLTQVLVVEDENQLLEMILKFLGNENFEAEGASSFETAIEMAKSKYWDVIVIDIGLGNRAKGGIELIEQINNLSIPIILASGMSEKDLFVKAINLDVDSFLEKPYQLSDLKEAILKTKDKPKKLDRRLTEFFQKYELSSRERQVLQLAVEGISNLEISKKLETTERTIKAHFSNIFRKSDSLNRSELFSKLLN